MNPIDAKINSFLDNQSFKLLVNEYITNVRPRGAFAPKKSQIKGTQVYYTNLKQKFPAFYQLTCQLLLGENPITAPTFTISWYESPKTKGKTNPSLNMIE